MRLRSPSPLTRLVTIGVAGLVGCEALGDGDDHLFQHGTPQSGGTGAEVGSQGQAGASAAGLANAGGITAVDGMGAGNPGGLGNRVIGVGVAHRVLDLSDGRKGAHGEARRGSEGLGRIRDA